MIFSSPRFFVFVVVLLLTLRLVRPLELRLWVLLVASCLFYAAWDWRYLGLLLLVSTVNWACGAGIAAAGRPRARRAWVAASVAASLAILGWFKYADFFAHNLNHVFDALGLGARAPLPHVLLPAGISFYVFKTMSYTIDIYRRELTPTRSAMKWATFATFFPELIAGPIVRASVFLPQMGRDIGPNAERLRTGASLFLLGLTKKMLIADPLAGVADPMFAAPGHYSGASLWLGLAAYTLQIYCDFSGYSDMAVGCAKAIGYDLPRNFRMPYLSADVAEFWRRWHITLSTWLRDYLYIPLGGNRRGRARTYANLAITMLLGGLWHGASWNFVAWGGLHGGALALHRAVRGALGERLSTPRPVAIAATLLFVMLCWVPFRSPDFATTREILRRLFTLDPAGAHFVPVVLLPCLLLVAIGHVVGHAIDSDVEAGPDGAHAVAWLRPFGADVVKDPISGWIVRLGVGTVPGMALVGGWLLALFFFAATGASPFIYFQF